MKNSSKISRGVVNILLEMQERHSTKHKEDQAEKLVLKNLGSQQRALFFLLLSTMDYDKEPSYSQMMKDLLSETQAL